MPEEMMTAMIRPKMPHTPERMTGMIDFMTISVWTLCRGSLAIVERPSADFHVPYAAPMLPKTSASAAPRKPKNGAYSGQYGEADDMSSRVSAMGGWKGETRRGVGQA